MAPSSDPISHPPSPNLVPPHHLPSYTAHVGSCSPSECAPLPSAPPAGSPPSQGPGPHSAREAWGMNHACTCASDPVCVCACVRACVCVCGGGGERTCMCVCVRLGVSCASACASLFCASSNELCIIAPPSPHLSCPPSLPPTHHVVPIQPPPPLPVPPPLPALPHSLLHLHSLPHLHSLSRAPVPGVILPLPLPVTCPSPWPSLARPPYLLTSPQDEVGIHAQVPVR